MRYVSRHEFCRAMHGRLPLLSASRLPINPNAHRPSKVISQHSRLFATGNWERYAAESAKTP
jgi:hypothetical protein